MAKNQIFGKKKNKDGSDYIDPKTNDFVMEVLFEEEVPDEALKEDEKIPASKVDFSNLSAEDILILKDKLK